MCQFPVKVKNPYFSRDIFEYREGEVIETSKRFVSKEQYIEVPCGKCAECRNSYFMSIQQRAQMEARTSHVYMITLTYNNEHIPYIDFLGVDNSNVRINYANVEHIQSMFKRLRNHPLFVDRHFRYLAVTEYGSARFRPHHHILLFVGKKNTDTLSDAEYLETELFMLIQLYYAVNVGSRKQPKYIPLFTYATDIQNGKVVSNYDVRLVKPKDETLFTPGYTTDNAIAAATAYITTYVNKPSLVDEMLEPMLPYIQGSIQGDIYYRRVLRLLRTRVYYSKHFGFGFDDNGLKVVPSLRSSLVSPQILSRSQLFAQLPDTFDELYRVNFDLAKRVHSRMLFYRRAFIFDFNTTYHYLDSLNEREVTLFFLVAKYFPKVIKLFYHDNGFTSINYYPKVLPKSDYDSNYQNSFVYKELRKSIEAGIAQRLPYLAFPFLTKSGYKFMPLCKYYRRYVCTYDDLNRMYDALGIVDYDDYIKNFDVDIQRAARLAREQKNNGFYHDALRSVDPDVLNNFKQKIANIITISPSVYDIINP